MDYIKLIKEDEDKIIIFFQGVIASGAISLANEIISLLNTEKLVNTSYMHYCIQGEIPPSIYDQKYKAIVLLKRLFLTPNSVNAVSLANTECEIEQLDEYAKIFSKGFVSGKLNILTSKRLD